MNIPNLIQAVENLDAALSLTIEQYERDAIGLLLNTATEILRRRGVFVGTENKFTPKEITLQEQACNLRRDAASLSVRKSRLLPTGTPVFVDAPTYRGIGVVSLADGPADTIAVFLENGNTWWYPVEDCQPIPWGEVPRSIRRAYLRRKGYKLL